MNLENQLEVIKEKIESERELLHDLLNNQEKSILDPDVIQVSMKLDKLIVEYELKKK